MVSDPAAIMTAIQRQYALPIRGTHGVVHWARVLENGQRIADANGADRLVVTLFALFHDARRVNENHDHGHGERGAEFAKSLRGTLVHLDEAQFAMLSEACRLHTDGLTVGRPTVQTCWDADRLDLGRVGIKPEPHLLCTDAGRDLLAWAHARAVSGHVPVAVLDAWGAGANPDK